VLATRPLGVIQEIWVIVHKVSQVATCVQAPLGAACASYGEAAVAQVTELGEGGRGVYGISPGSEGICG